MTKRNRTPVDCLDAHDRKVDQARAICQLLHHSDGNLPDATIEGATTALLDLLGDIECSMEQFRRQTESRPEKPALRSVAPT